MNYRGQAQRQVPREPNVFALPKFAAAVEAQEVAASSEASRLPQAVRAPGPGRNAVLRPSPVSMAQAVSPSGPWGLAAECRAVVEHKQAACIAIAREQAQPSRDGSRATELREKRSDAEPVALSAPA